MTEKKHSGGKLPIVILILILAGLAAGWYYMRTWPLRFHGELDQFFGAGNWETVSEQTKESMIYSDYIVVRSAPSLSGETAGKFHEWDIAFTNCEGGQELWTISDHTLKINNDEHWFPLDPERYTARQALGQELMEISFAVAGEQIHKDILQELLPEAEAGCITVDISFRGGWPEGKLYGQLLEEPWFNIQEVDAEQYLRSDLYDFFIDILAYNYRVDDLSEVEQQHLFSSLGDIEQALRDAYGEYVDYKIYLGEGFLAEYKGPLG